jgi:glyoxylase-like metal-dependent hydrolase (beta-lactamase superfamily II)
VIADVKAGHAIVIDPGGDFERIKSQLDEDRLTVTAIVHTHTHIDHVGATAPLQRLSGAEAHINEGDRFLYDMLPVQSALLGVPMPEKCDMLGTLEDGFTLRAGELELGVMHTPGHTPGSVCFYCESQGERIAFTGDTLFQRGIGRTDLWGGDSREIQRSLKNRLLTLEDDTVVIPGHGPSTSIGDERRMNPFLRRL